MMNKEHNPYYLLRSINLLLYPKLAWKNMLSQKESDNKFRQTIRGQTDLALSLIVDIMRRIIEFAVDRKGMIFNYR